MIHDSLFDIKDDEATKLVGSGHYRVHPDVYHEIKALKKTLDMYWLALTLIKNDGSHDQAIMRGIARGAVEEQ